MSIYRPTQRLPADGNDNDNDVRQFAKRALACPVTPATADADPGAARFGFLRKAIATETVLSATVSWAAALPEEVRPYALMRQYARVANRIAVAWRDPAAFDVCMSDLLIDRRGGRRGFPDDVSRNLLDLRDYHELRRTSAPVAVGGAGSRFGGR
jgi:hypothetical protein